MIPSITYLPEAVSSVNAGCHPAAAADLGASATLTSVIRIMEIEVRRPTAEAELTRGNIRSPSACATGSLLKRDPAPGVSAARAASHLRLHGRGWV
jgi:hypothetical protein